MSGHKSATKRPIFGCSDLRGDRGRKKEKREEARYLGGIVAPPPVVLRTKPIIARVTHSSHLSSLYLFILSSDRTLIPEMEEVRVGGRAHRRRPRSTAALPKLN